MHMCLEVCPCTTTYSLNYYCAISEKNPRRGFLNHCIESLVLVGDVKVVERRPKHVFQIVADIEQVTL